MKRRDFLSLAAAGAALQMRPAWAQTFPTRPIRLVVPFAPGGSVDVLGRITAEGLTRTLGQPVVVDNKGGAGGALGTMEVVRAAPDGYTLLMVSPSITASNPAINPNIPYNPVTDLTAIINVAAAPTVLAVRPSFPAKTYAEFIAEVKKYPDRYTYSSSGVGGILHLQMEVFKVLAGISMLHVPFKGAGPAVAAVLAGDVDVAYDSLPSMPYVSDGRLRPIVVCAPERVKELPGVPTFKEVGVEAINRMPHFGLLGPKGMPKDLVDRINAATRQALDEPAVRKRIEASGSIVIASSPQEFADEIKALYEQLKKVVADKNLKMES